MTDLKFPDNFKFGVATSAHQIEGAWNVDGKTESIWDYQAHKTDLIIDKSNADIACDSYNKLDEDIKILKELKVDFYRFSLSWPRILPTGFANEINKKGIDYYNKLINLLIKNGIEPVITIYHWDLPQNLQELGGWTNPVLADYYVDFAKICFEKFGDRVKTWITINEPFCIAHFGYGSKIFAPCMDMNGRANYLAGHTILRAHAKAFHVYDQEFRKSQKGRIGISLDSPWCEPATDSITDNLAAEIALQMHLGWFLNPIYSKDGDYPSVMRKQVDGSSELEGHPKSRLPEFTEDEIRMVRGSSDFLGLNHYVTMLAKSSDTPNYDTLRDTPCSADFDESWESTARFAFKVVPWGLRKLLNWIRTDYGNPEVIITENGYAGSGDERVDDEHRVRYYNGYLKEVLNAIKEDKCNVTGYTAWSLMDNFEWNEGYTLRFGLYYIDFNDPERKRVPKKSAFSYQNIIVTRSINENVIPDQFLHE